MLKKIISLITTTVIMLSSCFVFAAQAADMADNYNILSSVLGVTIDTGNLDAPVTRVELAKVIIQITDTELTKDGKVAFVDVPQKHADFTTVNTVYVNGLMSGYEDGTFRPYDQAVSQDITDMALQVLGYDSIIKSANMTSAQKADIISNIGLYKGVTDGKLTQRTLGKVLLNLLDAKVIELSGVGGVTKYEQSSMTYLEKRSGYVWLRGVVQAVGGASIFGADTVGRGQCVIDGKVFSCKDIDMLPYLGIEIDAILDEDSDSIEAVKLKRETDEKTIKAEDITEYNDYTYAYEIDNGRSIKKISIPSDARIVFNGKNMVYDDENLMIPQEGSVRFVNTDSDSKYDLVVISSAINVKVMTYIENDVLSDSVRNMNINIKDIDMDCYLNGVKVDSSNIAVGKYIRLYPDAMEYERKGEAVLLKPSITKCEYIRCEIIQENKFEGTVTAIGGDEITIDSTKYRFSEYINSLMTSGVLRRPALAASGTFYTDESNKIIAFDSKSKFMNSNTIKYGFLLDCFEDEVGDMYIKVVNEQAASETIKASSKLVVNKQKKTYEELKHDSTVSNEKVFVNGVVKKQLVMYEMNDKNEMSCLYIAKDYGNKYILDENGDNTNIENPRFGESGYEGYDTENFALNYSTGQNTILHRNGIDHLYAFTEETIGFKIPKNINDIKRYEVVLNNGKNLISKNQFYAFKVYNVTEDYDVGAYVVDFSVSGSVTRDAPLETRANTYITGKSLVWDEEELETTEALEMKTWGTNGLEDTNVSCDDKDFADADTRMKPKPFGTLTWKDLDVGDAILTNIAADGSLISFTVMFDYSTLYNPDGSVNYRKYGTKEGTYMLSISKVISISDSGKIVFSTTGKDNYADYCSGSTSRIALFEEGKFSNITIDDVRVGDTIYTRSGDGVLRDVIVYR